jgi:hypothetical protein
MQVVHGDLNEKICQYEALNRAMKKFYDYSYVPAKYFLLSLFDFRQDKTIERVSLVRPEVIGVTVDELPPHCGEKLEWYTKYYRWSELWREMLKDPILDGLHENTRRALVNPDFQTKNTVYVASGDTYRIIDW